MLPVPRRERWLLLSAACCALGVGVFAWTRGNRIEAVVSRDVRESRLATARARDRVWAESTRVEVSKLQSSSDWQRVLEQAEHSPSASDRSKAAAAIIPHASAFLQALNGNDGSLVEYVRACEQLGYVLCERSFVERTTPRDGSGSLEIGGVRIGPDASMRDIVTALDRCRGAGRFPSWRRVAVSSPTLAIDDVLANEQDTNPKTQWSPSLGDEFWLGQSMVSQYSIMRPPIDPAELIRQGKDVRFARVRLVVEMSTGSPVPVCFTFFWDPVRSRWWLHSFAQYPSDSQAAGYLLF